MLPHRGKCQLGQISKEEISEEKTEEISGTTTDNTGIEVGQEASSFQTTLGEIIEVAVGPD